ncbi:UDP-GlcNAc:betaGal beta-1,3-N-acetylglucosaminyltransferase-like protein 1 [Mytilus edulis]|uniref:UDP-GlcNAc:betaGal beta-1,3-N-acetylglucosaminyltransferase-like protein 1 n=1 Tax=Mytilus edulis TaxID=6550 RepID=A0A8S3TQY8_MYTED|nr:UDP-GlcNAc:betaGal beta-1,3-N-acetylglucosaminyltransferase-like protein 1 [Mytilus edulis]
MVAMGHCKIRRTWTIIIPVYNGSRWIDECFQSIANQTYKTKFQVSVYNDGSKDDVMNKDRALKQYQILAQSQNNVIVGCRLHREPVGSTERYTRWANNLPQGKLMTQIYTSHGPTVIMPTWFCSRSVFDKVGGFDEGGKGVPEDLIFFYKHLNLGGTVMRIDEDLLMYRYHQTSATFSVKEETIWNIRLEHLQKQVLSVLSEYTVWNAGKQGRKFFRSLSTDNQNKVKSFCDVDEKKIQKGYYTFEESKIKPKPKIPIVHYTKATPPFIICLKLDMTDGEFEKNLASMKLTEGTDYFLFS